MEGATNETTLSKKICTICVLGKPSERCSLKSVKGQYKQPYLWSPLLKRPVLRKLQIIQTTTHYKNSK